MKNLLVGLLISLLLPQIGFAARLTCFSDNATIEVEETLFGPFSTLKIIDRENGHVRKIDGSLEFKQVKTGDGLVRRVTIPGVKLNKYIFVTDEGRKILEVVSPDYGVRRFSRHLSRQLPNFS